MYKDKDKQREADRERQRRHRERIGYVRAGYKPASELGVNKGVTESGCDKQGVTRPVERTVQGNIRVSKPGDADYVPQCETTRAFIEGRPKRPETGKRGKDIKCFADLPPDVQQTIDKMSTTDGKLDKDEKAKRTAAAIRYQHLFPYRYHAAWGSDLPRLGVVTGKPGDADYNGICTEEWRAERGR